MENLVEMINGRCRDSAAKNAYLVKREGVWDPVTWAEVDERVDKIAAGLISIGIKPGDKVCILGSTRLEWVLCDFAVLRAGGVSVGIYPTLSGEQSAYILGDCSAKVLFVEESGLMEKVDPYLKDLPGLERIISWDESETTDKSMGMSEIIQKGEEALAADPDIVKNASAKIKPEDMAIIIYTSGTTGPPKGACLSNKNIVALIENSPLTKEHIGDTMMFFLPLAHAAERIMGNMTRVYLDVTGAFVSDISRILDDIGEIKPTFFGSVPRIFEKAYAKIQSEVEAAPPLKQKMFRWAEDVGKQVSRLKGAKTPIPPGLALKYKLADKLVLNKIRALFGGRVNYFLSGAAPISLEILEFFDACGMLVLEAYGQTEMTAVCTFCTPDDYRLGSVGKPFTGVDLKIADDGEIMVKGDIVFMGYLNQPELTAETVTEDGWIHSGDLGKLDEDGFLWITGRKKEIIITAGGKNVTPSNIENLLKNHPLIEQAMVHGDRRKYLTALIALEPDRLQKWADENGHGDLSYQELVKLDEVKAEVMPIVEKANKELARFETIKKFALLPALLDVETGEMTPTMKVRRSIVEEKYMHLLDELYD